MKEIKISYVNSRWNRYWNTKNRIRIIEGNMPTECPEQDLLSTDFKYRPNNRRSLDPYEEMDEEFQIDHNSPLMIITCQEEDITIIIILSFLPSSILVDRNCQPKTVVT